MDVSAFRLPRARDRIPALILTLGLQAGFLLLLLHAFQQLAAPRKFARETLLLLPRPDAIEPAPRTIDARGRAPSRRAPPIVMPEPGAPASGQTMAAPQPDIRSLGRTLFGCAPESFASLTPEQRAACARPGEGLAILQAPNLMGTRSQAKDEAHWQEELAREQSPTMLPCMGGLNLLCLLKKIATGEMSDFTDPRTWPHYEVSRIPPEDFYRIEQAYDAWHKAHRESHLAPAH